MKLNKYLDRYLVDKDYTINLKNNKLHIMNYIEIEDFSNTRIIIQHNKGKTIITGEDLILSKMLDDELLVIGKIKTIEV